MVAQVGYIVSTNLSEQYKLFHKRGLLTMAKRITVLLLVGAFVVAVLAPPVSASNYDLLRPRSWSPDRVTPANEISTSADDTGWPEIDSDGDSDADFFRWLWELIPQGRFVSLMFLKKIDAGDSSEGNDALDQTDSGGSRTASAG